MANTRAEPAESHGSSGYSELWKKEDWWAVWLGLGIVLAGYVLYAQDLSWAQVVGRDASQVDQPSRAFGAFLRQSRPLRRPIRVLAGGVLHRA